MGKVLDRPERLVEMEPGVVPTRTSGCTLDPRTFGDFKSGEDDSSARKDETKHKIKEAIVARLKRLLMKNRYN